MSMEIHNVCIPISLGGTLAVGTSNILGFKVPSDAVGGGITITDVRYSSNAAIAAASAPNFTLVSLGTNGAINGTIASATGSAAFTAGTPRAGTVSTPFVDADNYVAVKWAQTAANADIPLITASVQYQMGK